MEEDNVEKISLIDFKTVWDTSVEIEDPLLLWDYLVYNGYIIPQQGTTDE